VAVLAAGADVLIDAILGTGARNGLREPAAGLVRRLAAARAAASSRPADGSFPIVVACDLPSGIEADSGEVNEPVLQADLTVTFGAAKAGLFIDPAEGLTGRMSVVSIGIEDALTQPALRRLTAADIEALFPRPARSAHKYSRGVLGIVAGSGQYPGAAQLATSAALATGVGMVRYLGPEPVAALIHGRTPEVVAGVGTVAQNRVQAWLVGPGIDGDDEQAQRARDALGSGLPVVADAGALSLLPSGLGPHVILTPHAGELSRVLTGYGAAVSREQIEGSPMHHVRLAAELTGATVLLKGATTLVASPDGAVFSQSEGTPWLAAAGSGDTLAGILGALLSGLAEDADRFARLGIRPADRWAAIAALGATLHGRGAVAASAGGPLIPGEISTHLSAVITELIRRPSR
jgi:hydroxyethylthiazole kinase-like uncharacterized protein yjeF